MQGKSGSSIKLEIISAYGATLARTLSWVIVSGLIIRHRGLGAFAMFSLIRTTLALLSYTSFGSLPAMVHAMAKAAAGLPPEALPNDGGKGLAYVSPSVEQENRASPQQRLFIAGNVIALITLVVGLLLVVLYYTFFDRIHDVPDPAWLSDLQLVAVGLGCGLLFRIMSDSYSGVIQAKGRITYDNLLFIGSEVIWVTGVAMAYSAGAFDVFLNAGQSYLVSGLALLTIRWVSACRLIGWPKVMDFQFSVVRSLMLSGLLITVAQLADFLYAPMDNLLINKMLAPELVGVYAPAIQVDAGLLMLMTGVSAVLLPRAAMAHARQERETVRQYYVRGTLLSSAVLVVGAVVVWLLSPWIFKLWLNDSMPATQVILPLVLIHTVVGGSSAVGRSILLGMGKVRPFTTAVLLSGALNVVLSIIFVKYFHLGLRGIIYGTIIAVVVRCLLWMPWYILRQLRKPDVVIDYSAAEVRSPGVV